jgi:uncharacterized protein (DUF362 family)
MNKNIDRRQFLRRLSVGISVIPFQALLTACGQEMPGEPTQTETAMPPLPLPSQESVQTSTVNKTSLPAITATPAAQNPAASPINTASAISTSKPQLVVTRHGEPEPLVRRAIEALGGIQQFIKTGSSVIIKPNICTAYYSYEYAATTNPWVVSTLVKLCLEAGASEVTVLDFPFGGDSKEAYVKSGIQEQVQAAGGQMQAISYMKFQNTKIPEGKDLKTTAIYDAVLKADALINVPIAKDHSLARLTLGMKNLMGLIQNRETIHFNLGQRLADLTSIIRPVLTVIDAVRILTANGPTGGNLDDVKKLDTIIASADIVAADSYATSLFGMHPDDISYITAGAAMKLGESDLSKVKIEEITVAG